MRVCDSYGLTSTPLFISGHGLRRSTYLARVRAREASFRLSMDLADLPYILELKKDDPVWDELGKKCLCCGSCSMVCPTCSCFNVADEIGPDGGAAPVGPPGRAAAFM